MSETTSSGAGGSAAPGWYTDPHDASQMRWWSGEGWTEHVSGGAAAQPADAQPADAQPADAQPVVVQPADAQPVVVQPSAGTPVSDSSFAPQAPVTSAAEPLPSRRTLRDPAVEANEASAAAEAALLAQRAAAEPAAPTAQEPTTPTAEEPTVDSQQSQVPLAAPSQPSAPGPTLPVQPRSFLEQAGYPPMGGAAPEAVQPETPVAPPASVAQPADPPQFAVPPRAPQPVQPLQADAWDQAAQEAGPFANLTPTQNPWSQNPASANGLPSVKNSWDTPGDGATGTDELGAAEQVAPQDGIQPLLGSAPATDPATAGWGLTPSQQETEIAPQRHDSEDVAPQAAGSSTLWGWLIAISPILAAGAIGYVLASTNYLLSGWPLEAAIAAPYVLVLLFALADRAALQSLGHSSPRSPAWALLSAPVYLIIRASETRREDGSGTGLTLVWFVSFLVALGGFIGYGFLIHHALIAGLPS